MSLITPPVEIEKSEPCALEEVVAGESLSPNRIVSTAKGGGSFPSDVRWRRATRFITTEADRVWAMTEGVRLCHECMRGADPLEGAEPPWSEESWEVMNQTLSTCAAVLGRAQGARIFAGARPRAGGREGMVFNKKSWGLLESFFKTAMQLPRAHFKMAVWSLMDAACQAHPSSFTAPIGKPFFPAPTAARGIIDQMSEAAGIFQSASFDAVGLAKEEMLGCWRIVSKPYGPTGGPFIGMANIGVEDAWESCSAMLDALMVKEDLEEGVGRPKGSRSSKRSGDKEPEPAQTPRL